MTENETNLQKACLELSSSFKSFSSSSIPTLNYYDEEEVVGRKKE